MSEVNFKETFQGEGIIRFGLIGGCAIALLFAIPMARSEIRASQARAALANIENATANDRQEYMNAAHKALSPPGPTGELYDLAAQLALLQNPIDLAASEALTKKALDRSPARAESWARLAYIELVRDGFLNQKALQYLARSFIVEPAGYKQFMLWRVQFMFANWDQLPDDLQEATLRSFRMLAIRQGRLARQLAEKSGNEALMTRALAALQIETGN